MIQFLDCTGGVGSLIIIGKRITQIVQMIVPITLLVMMSIQITKLIKNPEDKKLISKIRNSLIAAVVVFFIPMFLNILIGMLGTRNDFTKCWNSKNMKIKQNNTYIEENTNKKPIVTKEEYQKGIQIQNKAKLSYNGVSSTPVSYVGDDHYQIKFGNTTYEVYGQNETNFSGELLRDGRTFSTGGCGPTTLTSALSAYGYKGNPVEVNQAGSDVSVESHARAIEKLKSEGKLAKTVKVETHPKSSLPSDANTYYQEIRSSLEKNHTVVIDLREAEKINNNYGDVFANGGPHAHWVSLIGYDPSNDQTFVGNTCGSRKWFELKKMTDSTFEAVSGQVFNDESCCVGSWIEIYEKK